MWFMQGFIKKVYLKEGLAKAYIIHSCEGRGVRTKRHRG